MQPKVLLNRMIGAACKEEHRGVIASTTVLSNFDLVHILPDYCFKLRADKVHQQISAA